MNTRYRNLFLIFCFIVLITGCSNQASIKSATDDKVVIKAQPKYFTEAYYMAQKECQKNTNNAKYVTDETAELGVVAFDCVGQEVETEAVSTETEETPAKTEEVPSE